MRIEPWTPRLNVPKPYHLSNGGLIIIAANKYLYLKQRLGSFIGTEKVTYPRSELRPTTYGCGPMLCQFNYEECA